MSLSTMLTQFAEAIEKDTITIYGEAPISDGYGAVSEFQGGGIVDVVKEATDGQYTITTERWRRILAVECQVIDDAISGVARVQTLENPLLWQPSYLEDGKIVVQCVDYAGAAVNPPQGSALHIRIVSRKTKVGATSSENY